MAAASPPIVGPAAPLAHTSTRLPALDGLRGIGVILVLLAHFGSFDSPAPGAWLQRGLLVVINYSYVSLDVFFVLSSFLITRILLATKGADGFFRTFYARRSIRIFPLYYGLLFVLFVAVPIFVAQGPADRLRPLEQTFYWTYLQNWLVPPVWHLSSGPWVLDVTYHLWSLSVEEQFYLVWPLVVYFCSTGSLKKVCVACLVVSPLVRIALVAAVGADTPAPYCLTPAHMDGLALGALMALASREPAGLAMFFRAARLAALVAFVALLVVILPRQEFGLAGLACQTLGLTASAYLAAAIVCLSLDLHPRSLAYRVLDGWPLAALGRRSYGIYVLHLPVAYLLAQRGLVTREWFHALIGSHARAELAYAGSVMACCFAAGFLSWRVYERPILRLGRYLPYSVKSSPTR